MTDDFLERPPIASAPISVVLLCRDDVPAADPDTEQVVAAWLDLLRGLERPFELITVRGDRNTGLGGEGEAPAEPEPVRNDEFLQASGSAGASPSRPLFNRAETRGLGASLRMGLAAAQYPLVFYTVATAEFQAADLKKLLHAIDSADLVVGIRTTPIPWWLRIRDVLFRLFCRIVFGLPLDEMATDEAAPAGLVNWIRRVKFGIFHARPCWLGWAWARRRALARWLFALRLHDPECPFCLFRREVLTRIPIQSNGPFAPVEILAKANFMGVLMSDVPVSFTPGSSVEVDGRLFYREARRVFGDPEFRRELPPEQSTTPV